jgi:hypothetical protein
MGGGYLASQRGSPGHTSTGRRGRRLPAPFIAVDVGLQSVDRDRVQVYRVSTGLSRRRGLVRARPSQNGWRLQALVKPGLCPQGGDGGPNAHHLLCTNSGKRAAGVSLAPRAESTPQSTARPGGSGRGGVTCSSSGGQPAALLKSGDVHLSNNPLHQTAGGRCGVVSTGTFARRR